MAIFWAGNSISGYFQIVFMAAHSTVVHFPTRTIFDPPGAEFLPCTP